MDDTYENMLKVENKLDYIVANTNTCKLWTLIVFEIMILALVILF